METSKQIEIIGSHPELNPMPEDKSLVVPQSPEVTAHEQAVKAANELVALSNDPTGPEARRLLENARKVQQDINRYPELNKAV